MKKTEGIQFEVVQSPECRHWLLISEAFTHPTLHLQFHLHLGSYIPYISLR